MKPRHLLLALTLSLLAATASRAQSRLSLYPEIGYGHTVTYASASGADSRIQGRATYQADGFHAGAAAEFRLSEPDSPAIVSIRSGLLAVHDTMKDSNAGNDATTRTVRLSVPLHLKISARIGKAAPFIAFGPSFNYGIYGRTNVKDASGNAKNESYFGDGNRRYDCSLTGEAGVELPFGLVLKAGYRHGLTDILEFTGVTMRRSTAYAAIAFKVL